MHMEGTIEYVETNRVVAFRGTWTEGRRRPRAPAARGIRPRGADLDRLVRRLLPAARLTLRLEFSHERPALFLRHLGQSAGPVPVADRLRRGARRRRDHGRLRARGFCSGCPSSVTSCSRSAPGGCAQAAARPYGRRTPSRGRRKASATSRASTKSSTTDARTPRAAHSDYSRNSTMNAPTLPISNRPPPATPAATRSRSSATLVALGIAYFLQQRPSTTMIFVRHADTDVAMPTDDPPLNARGRQRAEMLADFLEDLDVVSASMRSTRRQAPHAGNAAPIAKRLNLPVRSRTHDIEGLHGPRTRDHDGDIVLIVSHADTIAPLIDELHGTTLAAVRPRRLQRALHRHDSGVRQGQDAAAGLRRAAARELRAFSDTRRQGSQQRPVVRPAALRPHFQ